MEGSLTGLPLPIILRPPSPLTDDELIAFSRRNKPYRIEKNQCGELVIMTPVGNRGGRREIEIVVQLELWARIDGRGEVDGPDTGWNLKDGSTRSPDASWTSKERSRGFTAQELERYLPLCPDFVVEVLSQSDNIKVLRGKMQAWIENGAQLAWMIDPFARTVTVYRQGQEPEELAAPAEIVGEGPVTGFRLLTEKLWAA